MRFFRLPPSKCTGYIFQVGNRSGVLGLRYFTSSINIDGNVLVNSSVWQNIAVDRSWKNNFFSLSNSTHLFLPSSHAEVLQRIILSLLVSPNRLVSILLCSSFFHWFLAIQLYLISSVLSSSLLVVYLLERNLVCWYFRFIVSHRRTSSCWRGRRYFRHEVLRYMF